MLRKFIRYVSLNITGMVSIAFCIFMDTFFIALAMGSDGLTALNLALPIYAIVNGTGHMVGVGGGARYATLRAEGHDEQAEGVFSVAFYSGIILSGLFMLLGIFLANPIAGFLGAGGHIHPMAAIYLRTILIMSPGLVLSNILAGFIRNDNAPRVAMTATMILAVANIILDYVFIFPLGLGMFGAALATMTGSMLGLFYLLYYWLSGKTCLKLRSFKRPLKVFSAISVTGMPSLIGDLSAAIVMTVFNRVFLSLSGNMAVAAFGIVTNLSMIVLAIFNGVGQGMQPLVSTAYGEGNARDQKKVFRYSYLTVMGLALAIYLVAFTFTDQLTHVFNSTGDLYLQELARVGVRIYFLAFLFIGISIVTIIYLSVTSAPRAGMVLSLLRGGFITIPIVLLLARLLGVTGVWLSYPIGEFLMMGIALAVMKKYITFPKQA
ncbi:MAG: MATE family efflux transporter [Turicibacter sp.]|nr:MATE family efflux transporter [Turicibacter sp.]